MSKQKIEIENWCCHCGNHDPGKLLVVKSSKIDRGKLRAYCRVCGDEIIGVPDKLKRELINGGK